MAVETAIVTTMVPSVVHIKNTWALFHSLLTLLCIVIVICYVLCMRFGRSFEHYQQLNFYSNCCKEHGVKCEQIKSKDNSDISMWNAQAQCEPSVCFDIMICFFFLLRMTSFSIDVDIWAKILVFCYSHSLYVYMCIPLKSSKFCYEWYAVAVWFCVFRVYWLFRSVGVVLYVYMNQIATQIKLPEH